MRMFSLFRVPGGFALMSRFRGAATAHVCLEPYFQSNVPWPPKEFRNWSLEGALRGLLFGYLRARDSLKQGPGVAFAEPVRLLFT